MKRTLISLAAFLLVFTSSAHAVKPFTLTIQRNMTCSANETIGRLLIDGKELGRTLELPWHNDAEDISRVQAGTYKGRIRQDGKLGWRVELLNVPNHGQIELHIGNFARDTHGCVLVGRDVQRLKDKKTGKDFCAVTESAAELEDIRAAMQKASDNGVSSQFLDITVVIVD